MKILSIGNSFSVGATKYLHQIAQQYGDDIDTVNLFVGGCSLERHYNNMVNDIAEYRIFKNGTWTIGEPVAKMSEYIAADKWDYITFQQASTYSYRPESYEPYLTEIANYARKHNPQATFLIHQTQVIPNARCIKSFKISQKEMYERLIDAYDKAAKIIDAKGILATGEATWLAMTKYNVFENLLYMDHGHLGHRYGEYMAGLVWYGLLTGKDVESDKYETEGSIEKYRVLVRKAAQEAVEKYRFN